MRVEQDIFPDIHFRAEAATAEGDMAFLGGEGSGPNFTAGR